MSLNKNTMNKFTDTAIVDDAVKANPRGNLNSSTATKSHTDGYGIIRT